MDVIYDAALQRLREAWNDDQVHEAGAVPTSPKTPYIVLWGDGGRGDTPMLDGSAGSSGHRLMPMAVGKTRAEVDRVTERALEALEGQVLDAPGRDCTPVWLESTGNLTRDSDADQLLSRTLFLTFHSTPKGTS